MKWEDTINLSPNTVYSNKNSDFQSLFRFCKENGFDKFCCFNPNINLKLIFQIGRVYHDYKNPIFGISKPHYIDHAIYFKNTKSGAVCLAYCPYHPLEEIKDSVTDWAVRCGLKAKFYENGWYYPDMTSFVILSRPGYDIKLPMVTAYAQD